MATNYAPCLPGYSVAPGCCKEIPAAVGRLDKTAVAEWKGAPIPGTKKN